jgi:hypothetical protein
MSDTTLYRVALEYEVAETFAERVEPELCGPSGHQFTCG